MASILVSEAEPDVRRLLVVLVERLGHEAVVLGPDVVVPPRADLLLVEPLGRQGLDHARLVRAFFPELPLLCLSHVPEAAGVLGRGPLHFLPKPFTLEQLQRALQAALAPAACPF